VFRDELVALFPEDPRALRLAASTRTLAQALNDAPVALQPSSAIPPVLLHGHCHQKALIGLNAEVELLRSLGVDIEMLDAGCCGMAGSFGFERGKYAVSQRIGERVLLPRVRSAAPETVLLLDGFSCREQVAQATGRSGQHLAEFLVRATRARPHP
jgi:Fe-S oxidoreductase